MLAAHAALHRGATPGRRVEHFCDPWPSEPLFPPGSEQSLAFLNAGEGFRARLDTAARRIGTTRLGALDFATVNAMALDPVEWPNFAALLGATKVVALYEAGELAWWPGAAEPWRCCCCGITGLLWLGLHTGRSRDNRARRWARDPVERLCIVRGVRPNEAAQLIARALGLTEAPRVAA
jgi:hypothetical protein